MVAEAAAATAIAFQHILSIQCWHFFTLALNMPTTEPSSSMQMPPPRVLVGRAVKGGGHMPSDIL